MAFNFVNWLKKKPATIFLGKEIAEADEREKERVESSGYLQSPLPNYDYTNWPNEHSLINPVPNELDKIITVLTNDFEAADDSKRDSFRKSINQDNIYVLLEFMRRAALFAVRNVDADYIHKGFIAVAIIEAERCDYRDVLVGLSFLYFGISQLDANETILFETAKQLSQGKTKDLLVQFKLRPIGSKMTEAFGYTPIQTEYGISFIHTNTQRYNPEKNLIKFLFEIKKFLTADKYYKGEITLERAIPPIWLNAKEDKEIQTLLLNAKGCIFLQMELRPEYHSNAAMQFLYVYLVESSHIENIKVLNSKVENTKPDGFARLGFSEDNIFCLLIQRVFSVNDNEFETNQSLKRFEEFFREVIGNT